MYHIRTYLVSARMYLVSAGYPDTYMIPGTDCRICTTWQDGGTQVRTQLPLRLCWAITMHKSPGQTLDKAVIDLGPKEACTGLTFVCLIRAVTVYRLPIRLPAKSALTWPVV